MEELGVKGFDEVEPLGSTITSSCPNRSNPSAASPRQ
jgi:hypothetical protein